MNHLIFTAVLTACLGIGGYQPGPEFFGPPPDELGHDPYYDPGQLNSSQTEPWPPLLSPHSTLSIAMYTSMYYILTYFARSFGRYNMHAKIFCWLMAVYLTVTALTGFQFINLLPYILQVVPIITGYYNVREHLCKLKDHHTVYQGQIHATLSCYQQDFKKLVEELNQLQKHTNDQFKLVRARLNEQGSNMKYGYKLDKAALGDTLHQVQKYVNYKVASMILMPPTPPL
ncbi:hypothetical protein DSO57_1009246 [Entomophthora muscae]|uniref:Uncharacterized protein n=1 Tax=Entomophthora muscae TaxID=34485 RepID=A0ACC2THI3_9FUNG|nr:hypothetical protein DSO57_1009246 [Entomophthora muscae]